MSKATALSNEKGAKGESLVYLFILINLFMENVNGCPKGIGLRNNFRKLLWEKKKKKKLVAFHISHESGVKNFLIGLLTITLRAPINMTLYLFIEKVVIKPSIRLLI